jgi:ABC-type transport system involved in cytochrome bd biosynthesis fused ATPase/permease subunit
MAFLSLLYLYFSYLSFICIIYCQALAGGRRFGRVMSWQRPAMFSGTAHWRSTVSEWVLARRLMNEKEKMNDWAAWVKHTPARLAVFHNCHTSVTEQFSGLILRKKRN